MPMNKSDGNRIKVGVELINIDIDKLKAKGLKLFLTVTEPASSFTGYYPFN
jgi:phosphotransferase system IIA component